jgi:DUF1680 family protein
MIATIPSVPVGHSHGYLCGLRGALDFCDVTSDPILLRQLEKQWTTIVDRGMERVDGNVDEHFPHGHYNEGCSESDWLRFNLGLYRLTGKVKYIEHAERILWNALFFNQAVTGGFGHRLMTDVGYGSMFGECWWCCNSHGGAAIYETMRYVLTSGENMISLNLFFPISATVSVGGQPVAVSVETEYPAKGRIQIALNPAEPSEFALRLRVPAWARSSKFTVNGKPTEIPVKNGFARLTRKWKKGDKVTMELPVGLRFEPAKEAGYGSLWYGPLIMAPELWNKGLWPQKITGMEIPKPRDDGSVVGLRPESLDSFPSRHPLEIPGTHFLLKLNYGDGTHGAIIMPIAEQTSGMQYYPVQLIFRMNFQEEK